MDRWTALMPTVVRSHTGVRLVGRLPEDAWIAVFIHLQLPDICVLARCSRKLAAISRDDRIWRQKLAWLDYKGPGMVLDAVGDGAATQDGDEDDSTPTPVKAKPPPLPASSPMQKSDTMSSIHTDSDFGDFFGDGDGDVSLVHDDGFGEFQTTNDATEAFGDLTLANGAPKVRDENLLMSFDEDAEAAATERAPGRPVVKARAKPTPVRKASVAEDAARRSTSTARPTGVNMIRRDVFRRYYELLLPYYHSFENHTTSSLLFTSSTLQPLDRSRLLSVLTRFCAPLISPTRSPQRRMTVLRNVQSAADFFESALLSEFERADNHREEPAMKEKATVLWELNGATSLVQVFVAKREIFYDQGHDPKRNLVKHEAPSGEIRDGIDFSAMNTYMDFVLRTINREGGLIARVFPFEADVLVYFADRIATDVLSDYIAALLSEAQGLQQPLFLLATAATFGQCYRMVDALLAIEPKSPLVTLERAEDVVFTLFEPHMDDYLQEEGEWIREVLENMCADWDTKTAQELATSDPTFLTSQNPDQVKKNVLAGFTKVLLLPVTIIPKTASYGLNALTLGATGVLNTAVYLGAGIGAGFQVAAGSVTPRRTASSVGDAASPQLSKITTVDPAIPVWGDEKISLEQGRLSLEPNPQASPSLSVTEAPRSPAPSSNRFDRMQLLLSLDVALQLIQADRDCLKRIQTFIRYPGVYGRKVRDAIEEVFIILLQTLSEKHICPAFAKATQQMNRYKPEEHEGTSLAPLTQFFELVHIGDTIQQMVDAYYEKEMATYIDKKDFLNAVIREKRRFETALDESVAQGLNAGISILMNQVEHLLQTRQDPRDFYPAEGIDIDLKPTQTCRDVIACLTEHCNMLRGIMDKQILEVFHQEVGIRLHALLLKHLKRVIVSIDGGFQLISDLNAYHGFAMSLRQPSLTPYFTSMKLAGELFIVDSAKDLGQLARDVTRYDGTLSPDDLYELCQRRADWPRISTQVEKALFGLKLGEDCVVV